MSQIAKTIAPSAIASQIALMSGNAVTAAGSAPQSSVARMVHAELKGGEAKHNFVMSIISDAILQAYKGNQRDIPEAMKLCAGKAVKAKAFYAGFHAVADMVKPIPYKGKFDAATNADVRTAIIDAAKHASAEFERAYLCVFSTAKDEAAAKKAAKAAAASGAPVDDTPTTPAQDDSHADKPVMVADGVAINIDGLVDAISTGALKADELLLIRVALATYDAAQAEQVTSAALATAASTGKKGSKKAKAPSESVEFHAAMAESKDHFDANAPVNA